MIERLNDFGEIPREVLPFLVYSPMDFPCSELSLRIADEKWPSIRFVMMASGKEYRIKEFFMDWFFTGFPKSLFKDFSSSYSPVENLKVEGVVFYFGKNYHGYDSVSGFACGTQLEIECKSGATKGEFMEVVQDLLSSKPDPDLLSKLQFPDRSHSAKGNDGDWYENKRVSRLKWLNTDGGEYAISGHRMRSSGIGNLVMDGHRQSILILEENGYEKAIWAEVTDSGLAVPNAIYNFRPGSDFYDLFVDVPGGKLLFREPDGPGILRSEVHEEVWTIGFSPGFARDEIVSFSEDISSFRGFLESTRLAAGQDRA